jgi:hypothetical protein
LAAVVLLGCDLDFSCVSVSRCVPNIAVSCTLRVSSIPQPLFWEEAGCGSARRWFDRCLSSLSGLTYRQDHCTITHLAIFEPGTRNFTSHLSSLEKCRIVARLSMDFYSDEFKKAEKSKAPSFATKMEHSKSTCAQRMM